MKKSNLLTILLLLTAFAFASESFIVGEVFTQTW